MLISTAKPFFWSSSTASSFDLPMSPLGTFVMPDDTHRLTVVPCSAEVPAAGSVRVTWSRSIVALSSVCTLEFTSKPAASRAARASAWDWPVTLGTGTLFGPAENQTVTVLPFSTLRPPAGACFVKVPAGSRESVSCLIDA